MRVRFFFFILRSLRVLRICFRCVLVVLRSYWFEFWSEFLDVCLGEGSVTLFD